LGGALIALLLGALCNPLYEKFKTTLSAGVATTKKWVLPLSIVLLGFSINAMDFLGYWKQVLCFIPTIILVIICTVKLGNFLGLSKSESMLIGIGNSICGSAAIAATAPLIGAKENDIARSLATINLLGILLLFGFPLFIELPIIRDLLHSYIIGGTLQSVGHVGALGGVLPEEEATQALAFKMCRVALLYPLCLGLLRFSPSIEEGTTKGPPWYVTGFAISMTIATLASAYIPSFLPYTGKVLLCVAMAGIGLKINLRAIFTGSPRPLFVGVISCLLMLTCNVAVSFLFSELP
jgi:uncharacterized integral membrane protein (TIGR00698 family)